MIDAEGRVWLTTRMRHPNNPEWCLRGVGQQIRAVLPGRALRDATPATTTRRRRRSSLIDTCFGTHHLQFAEDADDTLYFSGGGQVVGWLNTKVYDETGDERFAQGWCPTVLDTNGDGRASPSRGTNRRRARAPKSRRSIRRSTPVSSSGPTASSRARKTDAGLDRVGRRTPDVWCGSTRATTRPRPASARCTPCRREQGYRTRGLDVDRNGVLWTALAGSSHFASFDRSKCSVFSGPSMRDGPAVR